MICGGLKIDVGQHFTDRFGADVGLECVCAVDILRIHELFFGHHLTVDEIGQTRLNHDVVFKAQNALKITQSHIKHKADTAWE